MEQLSKQTNHNLSDFLELFKNSDNISPSMTMAQVRQIESPPLTALLDRTAGNQARSMCHKYLIVLCDSLTSFMGEKWSDDQMTDVAKMLYENYFYIRSADWVYFAKKAKSLHFGKVYGKFTPAMLMDWADRFSVEWTQESINLSIRGSESMKSIESGVVSQKEVFKALNGVKIAN